MQGCKLRLHPFRLSTSLVNLLRTATRDPCIERDMAELEPSSLIYVGHLPYVAQEADVAALFAANGFAVFVGIQI